MTQQQAPRRQEIVDEEARANIFGFPLVLMDVTREVMTSVPMVDEKLHKAPVNQLVHMREFPDASFKDIVSPNADTLYSVGFLDLKREPMILAVPAMGDRYYLIEMLDAWTNVFACPGTRTTGNDAKTFAIVGPGWAGELPEGVEALQSPTTMVWLIGRTQTNGKSDYATVHALQDRFELAPLSGWGKGKHYEPPAVPVPTGIDTKTPPVEQVARMDAVAFFSRLNALMKDNPPTPADAEAMRRFAEVGIAPGKSFEPGTVGPAVVESAGEAARRAFSTIASEAKKPLGHAINGWQIPEAAGRFGTDYLWRAVVALVGLGANLPEDAIYPHATTDSEGKPLTGEGRYEITFARGEHPPVRAFWSVSMYDDRQSFVDNPIGRYAIGDRDELKLAGDGSLTLYIQNESPGPDKESNWLPAPRGTFNLFMRLYWPEQEALEGKWQIPPVRRVA